ncbi:MAG TPA: pilus assembly protein PilP [Candidatus Binatia bacterium]|jgi:Tfp pilus assembly protein PilP|nr:pilus assembly protein PilP [Candidatus Binatia bacterium]
MKRALLIVIVLLAFPAAVLAEDEKSLPSQKTKDAVDRFNDAPAAVAKKLDALKETLREKLTKGSAQPASAPSEDPLALPAKKAESTDSPHYTPLGKRDPFQAPMKSQAKRRPRENLSPLERYELGQLNLVGVVWDVKDPRAMVEDSTGLGYIVRVGTPIGPNEGKIREIKPAEVLIEESYIDFYGARKNRQVSMRIVQE